VIRDPGGLTVGQHSYRQATLTKFGLNLSTGQRSPVREAPKVSDGTEEIELGNVIARLRRNQPRNPDTLRVCDALERRLRSGCR
jgi:hypothetical protein